MGGYRTLSLIFAGLCVARCTADPDAPINQRFPIRQMDHFFGSLSGAPAPPQGQASAPDVTHEPGYAPAYPPY